MCHRKIYILIIFFAFNLRNYFLERYLRYIILKTLLELRQLITRNEIAAINCARAHLPRREIGLCPEKFAVKREEIGPSSFLLASNVSRFLELIRTSSARLRRAISFISQREFRIFLLKTIEHISPTRILFTGNNSK